MLLKDSLHNISFIDSEIALIGGKRTLVLHVKEKNRQGVKTDQMSYIVAKWSRNILHFLLRYLSMETLPERSCKQSYSENGRDQGLLKR